MQSLQSLDFHLVLSFTNRSCISIRLVHAHKNQSPRLCEESSHVFHDGFHTTAPGSFAHYPHTHRSSPRCFGNPRPSTCTPVENRADPRTREHSAKTRQHCHYRHSGFSVPTPGNPHVGPERGPMEPVSTRNAGFPSRAPVRPIVILSNCWFVTLYRRTRPFAADADIDQRYSRPAICRMGWRSRDKPGWILSSRFHSLLALAQAIPCSFRGLRCQC